jgi:hypothetical protein
MIAAEHYPELFSNGAPKHELLEIHRSKISLHLAKAGYSYPTIRLPHTLSRLAGLPTRIYQTMHDGALAFLVVVPPKISASKTPQKALDWRLHTAEVAGSNPAEPIVLL